MKLTHVLSAALLLTQIGIVQAQQKWVTTWATAQTMARTGAAPQAPATAPTGPLTPQAINARGFSNHTVRMMVRPSLGGTKVRVRLSNGFGYPSVSIGAASIALRAKDSEIVAASLRPLTFSGKSSATLQPGVILLSDPVDLTFAPLADLAVSLYLPNETGTPTLHATGLRTTYIGSDNVTAQTAITTPITTTSYYWLAGIEVLAKPKTGVVVGFGDSITDGSRSSVDANHSWPALLAARLAGSKKADKIGVANVGISGNRVLRDGSGVSSLGRLDRDVFGQSGVKWMVLLEGINDIGRIATAPAEAPTTEDLIGAYKQIIERAHTAGIKIFGATLTPYEGANYYSEAGETVRQAVNAFVRSGAFDGVIDFDAATRDPQNPKRLRPEFDPGDHLHPNDKGYEAMANAIDLKLFK